jgi:hypothetical protein
MALARALRLFGLMPGSGPITADEVGRFVDGRLMAREARDLDIGVAAEAAEAAWQAAGGPALAAWLERIGASEAWARRLVAADLRRQRFIEVRFRSFAFVSEFDIDEALGPGQHPEPAREAARRRLVEAQVDRGIAEWLAEARARGEVRLLIREPVPLPFAP